jgi:hypothetical protein
MPKQHKYEKGQACIVNNQFPVAYVRKEGFMHIVRYVDGSEKPIHNKYLQPK